MQVFKDSISVKLGRTTKNLLDFSPAEFAFATCTENVKGES
jgi:hypothetical protein